jgi:hypothetical protein
MKTKISRFSAIAAIILIISALLLNMGCTFSPNGFTVTFPTSQPPKTSDSALPPEFNTLTEAWKLLNEEYVNKADVDPKKLSEGAVRGMMEALGDPHSL